MTNSNPNKLDQIVNVEKVQLILSFGKLAAIIVGVWLVAQKSTKFDLFVDRFSTWAEKVDARQADDHERIIHLESKK